MSPKTIILHTKFQGNRSIGSGKESFLNDFTIYRHGSHICHVTKLIFTNFHFLVPKSFPIIFGYKWPSGIWEKQVFIFISEWPWGKVKKWPWPWILMWFHLLISFPACTNFQITGWNSFQKIQFLLFLCSQSWPWPKIGQGHPGVIIWINYNWLESPNLHTKFHDNKPTGSWEEDF